MHRQRRWIGILLGVVVLLLSLAAGADEKDPYN
jgi:hypothetical protein